MRDIWFKAKVIKGDKWVEGYYVKSNEKHYILPYSKFVWYCIEIDPDTLCQYINMNDKNDTKIFEGDICLMGDYIGIISYCKMDGMFVFTYDGNIETNFGQIWATELEVVGNIYNKKG